MHSVAEGTLRCAFSPLRKTYYSECYLGWVIGCATAAERSSAAFAMRSSSSARGLMTM